MRLQCLHVLISIGILAAPAWRATSAPDSLPAEPDPVCAEPIEPFSDNEIRPAVKCHVAQSESIASAPPLFANLDPDTESEVILTHSRGIDIVNPHTCEVEYVIRPGFQLSEGHTGPILGDVDNDELADVFLVAGTTIQRWEYDAAAKDIVLKWSTPTGIATAQAPRLTLVDLNQDGLPEIIPNQGQMIDARSGRIYPGTLPQLHSGGNGSFAFHADVLTAPAPAGQGDVEMVYGTHIYRYDFEEGEWLLVEKHPSLSWGFVANVSLADIDLDGDIDAVITRWSVVNQVLIWDLQTDQLLGGGQLSDLPGEFGSRMLIANLDNDPYPEMAMSTSSAVIAFDDIVTTAGLGTLFWQAPTDNFSGSIAPTAFDFNNDGIAEVIYRDQSRIRIFTGMGNDGAAGILYNRQLDCRGGSSASYVTIGDIDNDHQAELLLHCLDGVRILESAGSPWGRAPRSWANTAYFYPGDNSFLAQANLNAVGAPLFLPLPDANIESLEVFSNCIDKLGLRIRVCNDGSADLPAGSPVTVYPGSIDGQGAVPISKNVLPHTLPPGTCLDLETELFDIPDTDTDWLVVINEESANDALTSFRKDCNYDNNQVLYQYLNPTDPLPIFATICHGEQFSLNNKKYGEPGIYHQLLTNRFGCDSLITLNSDRIGKEGIR